MEVIVNNQLMGRGSKDSKSSNGSRSLENIRRRAGFKNFYSLQIRLVVVDQV
jgi:hypothetical protein